MFTQTPCRRARPSVAGLFGLAAVLLATPADAAREHVVAVLYFDNNTGDAEFDVLKKGFADMMITDLAVVDGVVVVERDKMQSILEEVELQKSPYFDKRTAIRIGKGLGARYAVTGAIFAVKPKLRIDVRMIDIATGKVVVTSRVVGKDDELFELEQKLVTQFIAGLRKRYDPGTRPRTRVPDVDTLLAYSRGIDLADKGLYEDAEKRMAQVIRRAPTFALARVKRQEFLARLEAAKARRKSIRTDIGVSLAERTEKFLEQHDIARLGKDEAQHYLAYRAMRGRFIVSALGKHLSGDSGVRLVEVGHERQAKRLLKAVYANFELLIKERESYASRHRKTLPNGKVYLDTSVDLPQDARELARESGLSSSVSRDVAHPRRALAEFLLLGTCYDAAGERYIVGPTPSHLIRRFTRVGFKLLDEEWADAHSMIGKSQPDTQRDAIDALESHAEALLLRDERDQAIAKLQEILDRYPTSHAFSQVERQINELLGIKYNNHLNDLERYARGLKQCKDMDLRRGWIGMRGHRARTMGIAAARSILDEMEKHCANAPGLRNFWSTVYGWAATFVGQHGDCKQFEELMDIRDQHGGPWRDRDAYRKNLAKCPPP